MGGFALTVFTLVKCRNHWQLIVIGIWKLSMSLFNGAVGVHIAVITRKIPKPAKKERTEYVSSSSYPPLVRKGDGDDEEKKVSQIGFAISSAEAIMKTAEKHAKKPTTEEVLAWVFLYLPGMIVGFVGLASLIVQNWSGHKKLHVITYTFSGVMGFFILLGLVTMGFFIDPDTIKSDILMVSLLWFALFASLTALYGDWALGAMVDNLLGMPSGDSSALYWSYFILKRLTMFSA